MVGSALGLSIAPCFLWGSPGNVLVFTETLAQEHFKSISMLVTNVDGQRGWESGVLPQCGPKLTVDINPRS